MYSPAYRELLANKLAQLQPSPRLLPVLTLLGLHAPIQRRVAGGTNGALGSSYCCNWSWQVSLHTESAKPEAGF